MKTSGIITFYYKNYNCGGLLQSYATYHVLTKLGFDTKQICFDEFADRTSQDKLLYTAKNEGVWYIPYKVMRAVYQKIQRKLVYFVLLPEFKKGIANVNRSMDRYQQWIPHTEKIYTLKTISEAGNCFDVYVAGSDQIWGQKAEWLDAYTLTFVKSGRRKVAYAPSIARAGLTDKEIAVICENVSSFDAISLREEKYQKQMEEYLDRDVPVVLDPTMLLEKEEWDKMLESYQLTEEELSDFTFTEPYIFVYLLGGDPDNQKRIKDFAVGRSFKIVYCPYVVSGYNHEMIHWKGRNFGDYRISHFSPVTFVKMIKNASFVITDSFHACVFSILYHKEFVVLDRFVTSKGTDMNSRIDTLLGSLNLEKHKCKIGEEIREIHTEWEKVDGILNEQKKNSIRYLRDALIE